MARWIARVHTTDSEVANRCPPMPGLEFAGSVTQMPQAEWVVLEVEKDGVFLIRYSDAGEFAGDTWTPNRELALEVAAEEFAVGEEDFVQVPDGITDSLQYAIGVRSMKGW